jgi:hypothetical protein
LKELVLENINDWLVKLLPGQEVFNLPNKAKDLFRLANGGSMLVYPVFSTRISLILNCGRINKVGLIKV